MANPVPPAPAANPYTDVTAQMQKMAADNATYQVAVQGVSATMASAGMSTNLITSAHSAAANVAKGIGQGMVESSRK